MLRKRKTNETQTVTNITNITISIHFSDWHVHWISEAWTQCSCKLQKDRTCEVELGWTYRWKPRNAAEGGAQWWHTQIKVKSSTHMPTESTEWPTFLVSAWELVIVTSTGWSWDWSHAMPRVCQGFWSGPLEYLGMSNHLNVRVGILTICICATHWQSLLHLIS